MKLIVGLGNPGGKYAKTRHNLGWMVLDALVDGQKWQENKPGGAGSDFAGKATFLYCQGQIKGQEVELVKPTTFMNNSGSAVAYIVRKHNLGLSDIIVIHDDKDLNFGKIKIATDSSSAGHKGVQSIIDTLGSQKFLRIRIGIKNDLLAKMETDQFVLIRFNAEETVALPGVIIRAIAEIEKNI
jgi:PTH1 family peptidyl-tRNA hydrolase